MASTKTSSGFEVDLGSAVSVDRLRVSSIPTPFLKRFRLEGSGDRSRWTLLVNEGTLFDLPAEHLQNIEASFTAGEYRYLRLIWNDQNSGVVSTPDSVAARIVEAHHTPVPLRTMVEFVRLAAGPGHSRFQVRLPGPHLPLSAIELQVNDTRLLRPARVVESRMSGGSVTAETLGSAVLRRVVQDNVVAAELRIPIRAPQGREIEILVDDNSNPPLNLSGVTLEFKPQPWIYFETSSVTGLTARYGDSQAVAPQYDLEAVRRDIQKKELPEAEWEKPAKSPTSADAVDPRSVIGPGAAVDRTSFRFTRTIPESSTGLSTLLLDANVLANSRPDLGDLRIADSSGKQVQYLLERTPDVFSLPLTLSTESSSGGHSRYRIALPEENLPDARLVLTTNGRTFQRGVTVQIPRHGELSRDSDGWQTLARDEWRHDDPQSEAEPLNLKLAGTLSSKEMRLVID